VVEKRIRRRVIVALAANVRLSIALLLTPAFRPVTLAKGYASRFNGLPSVGLTLADGDLGFIEYSGSCCRNEKAVENGFSAPCAVYAPA
jgi:hypothetical protein